jgi:hypothetical protein
MLIIVVELAWMSTTSQAHFYDFWKEVKVFDVGISMSCSLLGKEPKHPSILSLSCKEWQCVKFVVYVRGLENYERVCWMV